MYAECQRCRISVYEPAICTRCGIWGGGGIHGASAWILSNDTHSVGSVLTRLSPSTRAFEAALRREQWTRSLGEQVATWRRRATEPFGAAASVGVAIGGAAAATTGAAVALAHGTFMGCA